jgi:D-beta-D-heptose 7-phosphate kinase/D-beta-D-heptose 1-phosphate adenosyltransferase
MPKPKAIIVSGYFNPIHKGRLEYFNNAKALADKLFVIVNNDFQRELKGSKEFQDENERMMIVSNIKAIDKAILSIDIDRTVCETIKLIANECRKEFELGFAMEEIKIMTLFQRELFAKRTMWHSSMD